MKNIARLAIVVAATNLVGCVAVSLHSLHPVRVTVVEAASSKPAPEVSLLVRYSYDSYGLFYFFRTPEEETATTDKDGVVVMRLADFRYRILLKVGNNTYTSLEKKVILEGGTVSSPPYSVRFSPA